MIRRKTHEQDAADRVARYWDAVVGQSASDPTPIPPEPVNLTSMIPQLQAAMPPAEALPEYSGRLLQRLQSAQKEQAMTTYQLEAPAPLWIPGKQDARGHAMWLRVAAVLVLFIGAALLVNRVSQTPPNQGEGSGAFLTSTDGTATPEATADGISLVWRTEEGSEAPLYPQEAAIAPDGSIWTVDTMRDQIRIYSQDGVLIDTWGSPGTGPGEFTFLLDEHNSDSGTAGIVFDSAGNIFVLDGGNRRVQKFSPEREFLMEWGSPGGGESQFMAPDSLAIGQDDTIYVLDYGRSDAQAFDTNGTFQFRFGGFGSNPGDLADTGWISAAPDGSLWIGDYGNDRIENFTADGAFVRGFGFSGSGQGYLSGPVDVAETKDGNLLVAEMNNHRVQLFDNGGHYVGALSDPDGGGTMIPSSVTVADDGAVYVTDFGRGLLLKYSVDWSKLSPSTSVINPIDPSSPARATDLPNVTSNWSTLGAEVQLTALASANYAPDGTIWIVDAGTQSIHIFAADGTWIEDFHGSDAFSFTNVRLANGLNPISGSISFFPDGSFLVADPGNNRVVRFDANRQLVGEISASAGTETLSAPGPVFAYPDGSFAIVSAIGTSRSEILRYGSDGHLIERNELNSPGPLAVASDGSYWLASGGGDDYVARKYDSGGNELLALHMVDGSDPLIPWVSDIAVDAAGNIYVGSGYGDAVWVFTPDGTFSMAWQGTEGAWGQMSLPVNINVGSDGRVLVTSQKSMNVAEYTVKLP